MTARLLQLALAFIALAALHGCATDKPMFQSMPDRMDGLFLTIKAEKPDNSIAVYDITQAGTLSFAGGVEAKRGETDWSTELSAAQRARVLEMVETFGWLERGPDSTHVPRAHTYEIAVRRGGTRERYTVVGDHPQVMEMIAFLDEICMHRFDDYLDRLPRAGEKPR